VINPNSAAGTPHWECALLPQLNTSPAHVTAQENPEPADSCLFIEWFNVSKWEKNLHTKKKTFPKKKGKRNTNQLEIEEYRRILAGYPRRGGLALP
jgi:hypothetical protein